MILMKQFRVDLNLIVGAKLNYFRSTFEQIVEHLIAAVNKNLPQHIAVTFPLATINGINLKYSLNLSYAILI